MKNELDAYFVKYKLSLLVLVPCLFSLRLSLLRNTILREKIN